MSNAAALPATEDLAPVKGRSKRLIVVIAALVVLAAAGGGAAWFFHQKAANADAKAEGGAEGKPAKKAEPGKPPVFNTLENFTVNLSGGDHFMQLGVVLQLKDEETAERIKVFLPVIRNHILLLLSSKTAEELESPKGKQALIEDILKSAREPLKEDGENVQAALLGSMLIQ